MELDLHRRELAVCRLEADAAVPEWAQGAADAPVHAIVRTPAELSIVAAATAVPQDVTAQRGWHAFAVRGPLDFGLTGVLADLARPLAEAGVPIFVVSTYDTDWLLVPMAQTDDAVEALATAGHRIHV